MYNASMSNATDQKFSETLQTYNAFASQFVQHFEQKLDITELDKFLNLLEPSAYVLDAGCGSARDSAYMMSKAFRALGVDLSEGLLAEAAKVHPEVETRLMSLTDLQLPAETFDGIWCKAALLHIDHQDVSSVLRSFYKVLKPGGMLFIQTKEGEGQGTQPVPFDSTMERLFSFFTEEQLTKLLQHEGFSILESYTFNGKQRGLGRRDQGWVVVFAQKA
jgi:ubiquinone/menaquinone biosynthesis C-methylase UbiE